MMWSGASIPPKKGTFDRKFAYFREMVENAAVSTCLFPTGELKGSLSFEEQPFEFKLPINGPPLYVDENK